MERLEVSSDVIENYSLLPSIFENYLLVVKVSPKDFLDMCFAMCMRNWYHGGNGRSLSIDKFVIGNSNEWNKVLSKLGVSPISGVSDSGLPRVQQQRLLFDVMSYFLCSVKDGEVVSNIKTALKKVGLSQLFVTIDSNSYFSRGKELLRGIVEDYSESDLVTLYRFYAEFLNICNGVAEEEKKEVKNDDKAPECAIKRIMEYYNSKTDSVLSFSTNVVLSNLLKDTCSSLQGVSFADVSIDEGMENSFICAFDDALIRHLIDKDTLSVRFVLDDVADSIGDKFCLAVSDVATRALSSHGQLRGVLTRIFKLNLGSKFDRELGAKVLTSLCFTSSGYVVSSVKNLERGS